MSSSDYQTPDLASVLRTLAGLAPQNQGQQAQQPALDPRLRQPPIQQPQPLSVAPATPSSSATSIARPSNGQKVKIVDPATIIDWSSGLRCVMKTVAKHETMLQDIRRMIAVQHEHEEQWWQGRQALIERQKARKEGQRKLDDVLKAVGGNVAVGTTNTDPEELAKELETFDLKVYRAQMQMVREMTTKLRSLGVPFFGTKTELVRVAGKSEPEMAVFDGAKEEKEMIDEVELVKLQRKMLAILEDMCSD